ncbi:MAG: hypothetical protein WBD40_02510 [Tepidisphaeraceae bacterium]
MIRRGLAATIVLGGLCIGLLSVRGMGQAEPTAPPPGAEAAMPFFGPLPPQTRLEGLAAQRGIVLIKGYTDVGELQADDGAVVRLTAVQIADTMGQAKERGLAVSVETRGEDGARALTYVDYDEIDALAAALETLVKLDLAASPLSNVQGQFKTRGDLEFANHTSNGGRVMTVRATQVLMPSGQVLSAAATFRPARLAEFRQQVMTARETLDRAKDATAATDTK